MREQAKEMAKAQAQTVQPNATTVPTIADLFEKQSPGSLQKLPEELRGMVQMMRVEATVSHSGPLPPSWELAEYCKYIPNAGDRLMTLVENQTANRIALEQKILPKQVAESGRGQILAAVTTFFAFATTCWLGYLHESAAACGVGVTTVAAVLAAFIGGKTAIIKNLIGKNPSPPSTPTAPKQQSK